MNIKMSVKVALARHEMTVKQLAERMGISRSRVYDIIKQPAPLITTIEKIASAFDMRVSEFIALGETETKMHEEKTINFSYAMGILRKRFNNFNQSYFWHRMRHVKETEENVAMSIELAKRCETVNLFYVVMEEKS